MLMKFGPTKIQLFVNWNEWDLSKITDSVNSIQIYVDRLGDDIEKDVKIEELRNIPNLEGITIISQDIGVAYYFDELFKKAPVPYKKDFVLLNDYEVKDRSNVNFKDTDYSSVYIPFDYIMYIPSNDKISGYTCAETIRTEGRFFCGESAPNCNSIIRTNVNEILDEILEGLPMEQLDDIDKSILVSNWLQRKMQFVEGRVSNVAGKKYICNAFKGIDHKAGNIETAINEKHGVCAAFARLSCTLLNNPRMNCKCNMIYSKEGTHDYFVQEIDGKQYVVDNTWNITRNPNRFEGALKAKSFSHEYLLVGEDKMNENVETRKHHMPFGFLNYHVENIGIPREIIEASVEKLKSLGVDFEYHEPPVFKQYEEVIEMER